MRASPTCLLHFLGWVCRTDIALAGNTRLWCGCVRAASQQLTCRTSSRRMDSRSASNEPEREVEVVKLAFSPDQPVGVYHRRTIATPISNQVRTMSDIGNTSLPTISTYNIQLAKGNATSNRQWQQAIARGVGNSH